MQRCIQQIHHRLVTVNGVNCLLTSRLYAREQSANKLIYFGNLTQTLCYNYVAIVILEVTLT